jgi:magnesium chelatase family protein
MSTTVHTFVLDGISAKPVRFEVDIHRGLPSFTIVGLSDAAVRETRERVRAAVVNSGFEFPLTRIVVNVAPGSVRRTAPAMDLAIVAALLAASGQIDLPGRIALVGEVRLDGALAPVPGTLPIAEAPRDHDIGQLIVPAANGSEAGWVEGVETVPLRSVAELRELVTGVWPAAPPSSRLRIESADRGPDLADLRGQPELRRTLEVAAAGGHGLLIVGPPDAGIALGASRIASILPPMGTLEALEVARVASAAGRIASGRLPTVRPFRAPHHTISEAGLLGGGIPARLGEVTLAHRGVLFLDEVDEFRRGAVEALRAPLHHGEVVVARRGQRTRLPSRFLLVASCNRSSPAHGPDDDRRGSARSEIDRLAARIDVLSDTVDIRVAVEPPSAKDLEGPPGEGSAAVRERVIAARGLAEIRLGDGRANGDMSHADIRDLRLDAGATRLLAARRAAHPLSDRGADPVLRVARTIADLDAADVVGGRHLEEAFSLR